VDKKEVLMLNRKADRRYCGYCATIFEDMTMEEHQVHMEVCERDTIRRYKKNKNAGKNPYGETGGELMEGGCK
jgi:hypothetical protein